MNKFIVALLSLSIAACTCKPCQAPKDSNTNTANAKPQKPKEFPWVSLFDGKTLDGWKSTEYGGEGEIEIEDGVIYAYNGVALTGITYQKKDFPKTNFEVSLDFKKTDGSDFACALTFPVQDSFCSYICGGWGGTTIGFSSIDHFDASNNETTDIHNFKTGQWYNLRVRVTDYKITAWIDGEMKADYIITGHTITTRPEVDLAKPLGIANFQTGSAFKNIKYRKVIAVKPKPEFEDDE